MSEDTSPDPVMPLSKITTMNHRCEGMTAYQAAKSNRQKMYQFAKMVPEYRSFYDEAEAFYVRLCAAMGVDPEKIFDKEEYKKSQYYLDLVSGKRA